MYANKIIRKMYLAIYVAKVDTVDCMGQAKLHPQLVILLYGITTCMTSAYWDT